MTVTASSPASPTLDQIAATVARVVDGRPVHLSDALVKVSTDDGWTVVLRLSRGGSSVLWRIARTPDDGAHLSGFAGLGDGAVHAVAADVEAVMGADR